VIVLVLTITLWVFFFLWVLLTIVAPPVALPSHCASEGRILTAFFFFLMPPNGRGHVVFNVQVFFYHSYDVCSLSAAHRVFAVGEPPVVIPF